MSSQTNGEIISIKKFSNVFIPEKTGKITIPEISIDWYNIKTGRFEKAILPSQTFDVLPSKNSEVIDSNNIEYYAPKVVVGAGREGSAWFKTICEKHDIATQPGTVDLGVRVECRDEVMKELETER